MSGFLASLPGACAQGIIWGIMAVGVYLTFKVLDLADLTVDGSFGTGGAVLVVCTIAGMNIWLAMLLAFLAGCIAGLVTGILHTKFGIPAILAGILTQLALYSVNLRIMSGRANVALNIDEYGILVSLRYIPKSILVGGAFALVIIGLLYWFFGTELGAGVRATIVALSGGLLAQYQGFADINMGRGAIVIGLAAVIIGDVIFGKLFKNFALRLLAAVLGGVIYYIVIQLVLQMGLNANDLKLFSALVVALFLGVPYWKGQLSAKHVKTNKGGKDNA